MSLLRSEELGPTLSVLNNFQSAVLGLKQPQLEFGNAFRRFNSIRNKVNVLHISPSFYPASGYGGTIYSGYSLCNSLTAIDGLKLRVLTTDSDGPRGHKRINVQGFPTRFPEGYEVYYCRRSIGADVSFRMFRQLWPMIRWADVVHLTAVYSPPTIPTLAICKLLRKPLVWSTRG